MKELEKRIEELEERIEDFEYETEALRDEIKERDRWAVDMMLMNMPSNTERAELNVIGLLGNEDSEFARIKFFPSGNEIVIQRRITDAFFAACSKRGIVCKDSYNRIKENEYIYRGVY